MKKNTNKAQALSTDVLIVVVIILFAALFLLTTGINDVKDGKSVDKKEIEANVNSDLILNDLKKSNIVDNENKVDIQKLMSINEVEMREELGIKSKFCIVFEKDGKLYKIDPNSNVNGIGSSDILVNGVPCVDRSR